MYPYYSLFFAGFSVVFFVSLLLSILIMRVARKLHIVDDANIDPDKKKHSGSIPLLVGSGAIVMSGIMTSIPAIIEYTGLASFFNYTNIPHWETQWFWFLAALGWIVVGGYFDDKMRTKPLIQFFFVTLAIGCVLLSRVRLTWGNFNDPLLSTILTAVWLYICAAATKFLDGHDGLVSSVGIIGLLGIASVALFDRIQQPLIAIFALVFAFALAGFLPLNFPKARAYLGEGASIAIGFVIGYLSLLISSKLVVANAVLGLFLLDLLLVWGVRIAQGRNFLTSGDRLHWHHRLLNAGLTPLQVLVGTTIILLLNVHIAIWLAQQQQNFVAWVQLAGFVVILLVIGLISRAQRKRKKTSV